MSSPGPGTCSRCSINANNQNDCFLEEHSEQSMTEGGMKRTGRQGSFFGGGGTPELDLEKRVNESLVDVQEGHFR